MEKKKKPWAEIQASSSPMICDFHVSYITFSSLLFFICNMEAWSSLFAHSSLPLCSDPVLWFFSFTNSLACLWWKFVGLALRKRSLFVREEGLLISFIFPAASFLAPLKRRISCDFFAQSLLLLYIFPLPTQAKVVVWKGNFHAALFNKVVISCMWTFKFS